MSIALYQFQQLSFDNMSLTVELCDILITKYNSGISYHCCLQVEE